MEPECTSLFCQEVLLGGVDNASGQHLDYATLEVGLIHYTFLFLLGAEANTLM